MQVLSRKITIGLFTTFIFSFIFAIISFTEATKQGISFSTLLLTFVVLSAPMFLLVGVMTSYIFENFIRSTKMKWFSYLIVGAVFSIPYASYVFPGEDLFRYSIFGAAGAVLFCFVQLVFNKYIYKDRIN